MKYEDLLFLYNAIKDYHWKVRADLLSNLHCSQIAKDDYEINNPNNPHAWDSNISNYQDLIIENDLAFEKARDHLKSLDVDKFIFRK